jgi:hypothetical protein
MSESDLKMMKAYFEKLRQECNTPEKALAQLQKEGLVDQDGNPAPMYNAPASGAPWR